MPSLPRLLSRKAVKPRPVREIVKVGNQSSGVAEVAFASNRTRTAFSDTTFGSQDSFSESRYYANYAARYYPALQTSVGVASVDLCASIVSSLPVRLQDKSGNEKEMPPWLKRPGGSVFKEISLRSIIRHIVASLMLDGMAYVALNRLENSKTILGLVPLEPWSVRNEITKEGRTFHVNNTGVTQSGFDFLHSYNAVALGWARNYVGAQRVFDVSDMLIWNGGSSIPGVSRGVSPFDLACTAVNVAIEVQDYAEEHYKSNAARPTVFIFKDKLVATDRRNLSSSIVDQFTGEDRHNVRAIFVSDPAADVKIEQIGDLPRDADVAEVRKYNAEEIAQTLRIPQALVGIADPGSSSYNSLHVQKSHFASSVIAPMVKIIEDGFEHAFENGDKLVFDLNEITRGDPMTNTQIAERQFNAGVASVDEARKQVGLTPLGYDQLVSHKNRLPLDSVLTGEGRSTRDSGEGAKVTGRPEGSGDGVPGTGNPKEN